MDSNKLRLEDVAIIRDVKVDKMMTDYGYTGYGYYTTIVRVLADNGNRYGLEDLGTIAEYMHVDKKKLKQFIIRCCEKYTQNEIGLLNKNDKYFWAPTKKKIKQVANSDSSKFMSFDGIIEDIELVHLELDFYNRLCERHGTDLINFCIKFLDNWLKLRGRTAKNYIGKNYNHKYLFRADAWVINEGRKEYEKLTKQKKENIYNNIPSFEDLLRRINNADK